MDFTDRVAVVTGSARGIGKAIAQKLFDAGAGVVIVDLFQEDVDVACRDLAEGRDTVLAPHRWPPYLSIRGRAPGAVRQGGRNGST